MVNLHRLLVFFVALPCAEAAAHEWRVQFTGGGSNEPYEFNLRMSYEQSSVYFTCMLVPRLTGYSARFWVTIPGTSATISSYVNESDVVEVWRRKLAGASRDFASLGNVPTSKQMMDGRPGPTLSIMVPVANFVDAWVGFETVCGEWRSKLTDHYPYVREKDLNDLYGKDINDWFGN